ncbi:MAG: hypothetical protein ACFCUQ_15510 [Kiloniellales bacterium]
MLAFPVPVLEFPSLSLKMRGRAVGEWLGQNWLGLVILALLGWGGTELTSIKERLSALETRQIGVEDRIDRIAEVLPDIRANVSWEGLYGPFKTAVLVSKPHVDMLGSWGMNIHLLNAASGEVQRYWAGMRGPGDDRAIMAVQGWLHGTDPAFISLREIEKYGMEVKKPTIIPGSLIKAASGISHAQIGAFTEIASMKAIEARFIGSIEVSPVGSWDELARLLQSGAILKQQM